MRHSASLLGILLMLGGVLLLSGCQGTNVSASSNTAQQQSNQANNAQHGYLYKAQGTAMFMQWTEVNNQLTGQMQAVGFDNSNPPKLKNSTHAFTGVHNGSSISISFTGADFLGGVTWTGTLNGDQLSLVIPNKQTGALDTFQLSPSTVSDYDSAVTKLQNQVQQAQDAKASADAQAKQVSDQQSAVANANDEVGGKLNGLESYCSSLANATNSLDGVLTSYVKHLGDMQTHWQKLQADAGKQPFDSYALSNVQYDLSNMQYDQSNIQYDDSKLKYYKDEINDYLNKITAEEDAAKNALNDLQSAVTANTSGTPVAKYTSNDVSTEITKSQAQVSTSTDALQKTLSKAASYDQQANQQYKNASQYVSGLKATN